MNESTESGLTSRIKPFNNELRQQLEDYQSRNNLTLTKLASELGTSPTAVSKYLNGKPEGDVASLEHLVSDILQNENQRRIIATTIFSTYITRALDRIMSVLIRTNDIGVISGRAGLGKTCGIQLYLSNHPSSIGITATEWRSNAASIQSALFNAISHRTYSTNQSRGDFICSKLRGSNRLVIVDNAHRLHRSAMNWLFDFADDTGCPLALVGNPEILDHIHRYDPSGLMMSRVGQYRTLECQPGRNREIISSLLLQICPEAEGALEELALIVSEHAGHFRSVRKQALLTMKIREDNSEKEKVSWDQAWKSARTQLIRNHDYDGPNTATVIKPRANRPSGMSIVQPPSVNFIEKSQPKEN